MNDVLKFSPRAISRAIAEKNADSAIKAEAKSDKRAKRVANYALRQAAKGESVIPARTGRFGSAYSDEVVHGKVIEILGQHGLQVSIDPARIGPSLDRLTDDVIQVEAATPHAIAESE